MERLFDRMGMPEWDLPEMRTLGEFTPTLDFSESNDAFVVKAEIPGIDPQDISVSLENQMLMIKGEKKHEKEQKDEQYYRMERSYGAFARTVRLPAAVDGSKVTAGFKNGLLTVTLPKAPGAKGSTIPVKAE
jgi:HSP20 family protein